MRNSLRKEETNMPTDFAVAAVNELCRIFRSRFFFFLCDPTSSTPTNGEMSVSN